jgi:hypothetical protein
MPIQELPVVSQWYRHLDKGYRFQVVSVDEDSATIEIQHFDGDVEELEFEDWHQLEIEPIEPPEDWTGPMDDIERDDLGYTETGMSEDDWSGPLEERGEKWNEKGDEEDKD